MTGHWEKEAFLKLARLGAIVFLPTKGDKYLMQVADADDESDEGKLRPPGGGKDTRDKNLTETIVREISEEFAIPKEKVRKKIKFLGYEYRDEFWGNAVFEMTDHGLSPGVYQASNDPEEKVRLVEASLDSKKYVGPDPTRLITEEAKDYADRLEKAARYFTFDELNEAGKNVKLITVFLYDPVDEDTQVLTTGLSEGETPEQAGVRTAKHVCDAVVEENAVERMPKKDRNHWQVRVLLPAHAKEASAEKFKPDLTPDGINAWSDADDRLQFRIKPRLASMASWPAEWTTSDNPEGWLSWYRDYHSGRRCKDDEKQIKRWLSFKARNEGQFVQNPTVRRAWSMVNWGIDPVLLLPTKQQEAFKEKMEDYKERIDARAKKASIGDGTYTKRDIRDFEHTDNLPGMHNTITESAMEWVHSVENKDASAYLEDMSRRFQPVKSGFVGLIRLAEEFGEPIPIKSAATSVPAPPIAPSLDAHGAPFTGPEAIAHALKNLDLDQVERDAKLVVQRKLKSKRPDAVKILGYIDGLRRMGYQPHELMLTRIPVIPPQFRPYSVAGDTFVPGDTNELYRDLINLIGVHKELEGKLGSGSAFNRLNIYDAVSALYGFGEPTSPKTRERGVSGFLKKVTGTNPKFSYVQRRLLSKDQDYVARGVIGVDPELGLDEIGVPEEVLWSLYSPYVQRSLVRAGMSPEQSLTSIRDRADAASKALDRELVERPVVYSRAPSWHKFNVIAGRPKRIKGDMIRINPLVTTGLNADFDGDTLNIHLPSLPETVQEAKEKLMPSRMLFSIKDRSKVMPTPKQEFIMGLYNAQRRPARKVHNFPTEAAALAAIRSGQVAMSDEVKIGGKA